MIKRIIDIVKTTVAILNDYDFDDFIPYDHTDEIIYNEEDL